MTAAWRALLRVARRDLRRQPARSLLVVLLVALPVAGLTAATAWYLTVRLSPEESATRALGAAHLAIYPADPALDATQPPAELPEGAKAWPIWNGEIGLRPGASRTHESQVEAVGVDLHGPAAGMFEVVEGRAPSRRGEVALTTELARQYDLEVGESVLATDLGEATVVGRLRDPTTLDRRTLVVAPNWPPEPSGFLVEMAGTSPADVARSLERAGWDVTTRAEMSRTDPEQLLFILVLGGFGFVVSGSVSAAAFAVSAQRRQHELALLAASGAESRHLRRSVLLAAFLLGATGAIAGLVGGLGAAASTLPWLEGWSNRAIDGLTVSRPILTGVACTGVLAAVSSSWFTARSAGRTPVAAALTARRPPRTRSTRLLLAGAAITAAGVVVTAMAASAAGPGTSEILTAMFLLVGAALIMVGLGGVSPWLVEQVAKRFGDQLPVGARIAMRDTARFRSRTAPIVMAIVAGLGLSIAVGAALDTIEDGLARDYQPWLGEDQLLVDGAAPLPLVEELKRRLDVTTTAAFTVIQPVDRTGPRQLPQVVTIADAALLEGLDAPAMAAEALAEGKILVLHDRERADPGSLVQQAQLIAPAGVHPVGLDRLPRAVPPIVLSLDTLEAAGIEAGREGTRWLVELAHPLTDKQLADVHRAASNFGQQVTVEDGPPQIASSAIQSGVTVGAGLLSLLIVGVGLALLSAETRHDAAILVAVGASPRSRRSLAAARAAVLTALGALLAVPAGLLPIWGLATSAETGAAAGGLSIPIVLIAVLVLGVPVIAATGAFVLTRSAPAATVTGAA